MRSKIKKIVVAALMAALACVATMIIKIPSPLKGYWHLGDCIVLVAGWILSPGYAFVAAGLGSALADLFSGYAVYVPATFLIKGCMALTVFGVFRLLHKRIGRLPSQILGAFLAELVMVLGYFLFEGFLYGFVPSLVNIPANAVQGIAGISIGLVLIKVFERLHLPTDDKKD